MVEEYSFYRKGGYKVALYWGESVKGVKRSLVEMNTQ